MNFVLIPIGRNGCRGHAKVSPCDAELVLKERWLLHADGYASNTITKELMHRFIFRHANISAQDIDHANRDPLDNRRENLRPATRSQNNANRPKRVSGSSRFKGVSFDRTRKKWQASIKINSRSIGIGRFNTEIEAARAYNAKAKELFKEFAFQNEIGQEVANV